jgi:hypothetical protein
MTAAGRESKGMSRRTDEIDREVDELRRSISATRTHGILYYLLLVTIIFTGFVIGYATHSLVGAAIILVGQGSEPEQRSSPTCSAKSWPSGGRRRSDKRSLR